MLDIRAVLQQLLDVMDSEGRAYIFADRRYKVKLYPVYGWLWRMEVNDTYREETLVEDIRVSNPKPKPKRVTKKSKK